MLEKLDQIDWSKVHDVYGPAPDIPEFIRGLASENPDIRSEAKHFLNMKINHQGGICEAMIYVVPFYVELLQNPGPQDKAWLFRMLWRMTTETSPYDIYAAFPSKFDKLKSINELNDEWREKYPANFELATKIRQAIFDHLESFWALLSQSEDFEIRMRVPYLLHYFIEHRSILVPALKTQLGQ